MNTILYENELPKAYEILDALNEMNVDGVIVTDLSLFSYIKDNFKMEAHCSTQMGIDSLDAVKFFEKLKADRIVPAREVSISELKKWKKESKVPLELFIHGALCVSFSGNCLMSGLIGLRSGNRGRCVGCCRKEFTLYSEDETYPKCYLFSMKDLNTTAYIKEIQMADSLKIEGRMKDPHYVASVVKTYRNLIDGVIKKEDANTNLSKTFNRTFTKGYLFDENKELITNTKKPNNYGYKIGRVSSVNKNRITIELFGQLNQGDQIRIDSKKEINVPITKMYDRKMNLIKQTNSFATIELKETPSVSDIVYKTMDVAYLNEIKQTYPREFKRLPISFYFTAKHDRQISLTVSYEDKYLTTLGAVPQTATNQPTTKEKVYAQLEKIGDTPYYIENAIITIEDDLYIPIKDINEIRRNAISLLNSSRLMKRDYLKGKSHFEPITFPLTEPKLACYCTTNEQYEQCLKEGIEIIYYKNVERRNMTPLKEHDSYVLVGGYNGLYHYKGHEIITDFSLNVVNAKSVNLLHQLGASRVTISHEINNKMLKQLVDSYYQNTNGYPNLEMIVYGRSDLFFTKYCPLKKFDLCGKCKNTQYYVKDDVAKFPIISHNDCSTTILNSKILNLVDDLDKIKGINVFRLNFTIENSDEVANVIQMFKEKMSKKEKTTYFDDKINTRGHFNKDII